MPVSQAIGYLAEVHTLGEMRKTYNIVKTHTQIFGWGVLCILFSLLWIFPTVSSFPAPNSLVFHTPSLWILPALPFLGTGCYFVCSRRFYTHWRISLWQNGFIYERGGIYQVFRWNQITRIHSMTRICMYTIKRRDGYTLTLSAAYPELEDLVENILQGFHETVQQE